MEAINTYPVFTERITSNNGVSDEAIGHPCQRAAIAHNAGGTAA